MGAPIPDLLPVPEQRITARPYRRRLSCDGCGAPLSPRAERCEYCGSWLDGAEPDVRRELEERIDACEPIRIPPGTSVVDAMAIVGRAMGITIGDAGERLARLGRLL